MSLTAARPLIAVFALIGIYVSVFMLRKQLRAARGELPEPSVVMSPRAKAGGVPNALLGLIFYLAVLAAIPFLWLPVVWVAIFCAALVAAAFSVFLAYSLVFVTRMPCAYCWAGHVINWSLLVLFWFAR